MDDKVLIDRMAKGFLPDANLKDPTERVARATEYIAFELHRIHERLAVIEAVLKNPGPR